MPIFARTALLPSGSAAVPDHHSPRLHGHSRHLRVRTRTLVIADPHERIEELEAMIAAHPEADHVIILGDYFDSFDGLTWRTGATARWVLEHARDPRFTLLLGNHDVHYAFPRAFGLRCSGYDPEKHRIISGIIPPEVWRTLKLHTWIGGWLLSHAGIHPRFAHPIEGMSRAWIDKLCAQALEQLHAGEIHDLLRAGPARGGGDLPGGILWCDWQHEFTPVRGLNQMVGHSNAYNVRTKHVPRWPGGGSLSLNYCIDTFMTYLALIDDGRVTTEQI